MRKNIHKKYIDLIETKIQGIPCLLGVLQIDDGSVSIYDVLDRRGYPAHWLEKKMKIFGEKQMDLDIEKYEQTLMRGML